MRQGVKHKALTKDRRTEDQIIDEAINEVRAIKEAMLDSGATSNFIQSADGI